jgi:hypothetical protein
MEIFPRLLEIFLARELYALRNVESCNMTLHLKLHDF